MCLILFAWRVHADYPLVMAANRDEFHTRPTARLQWWTDAPGILAGRDLQAGGTWMGVGRNGRFAAVTNHRSPTERDPQRRSRGGLVTSCLQTDASPGEHLAALVPHLAEFNGFNLLAGDVRGELCYLSKSEALPRRLEPGVYGLSNDRLDTPWPKLVHGRRTLTEAMLALPDRGPLLQTLLNEERPHDHELPNTGVGLELERMLSSVFIRSAAYGTRASTLLTVSRTGRVEMDETTWRPDGRPAATTSVAFNLPERRVE